MTHGVVWLMTKLIEQVQEMRLVYGRLRGFHEGWKVGEWGGKGETGRFHPKTWSGWSPAPGDGGCRMGPGVGGHLGWVLGDHLG